MQAYQPYIEQLESLLCNSDDRKDDVLCALNGEPYMELRKLVSRSQLKEHGVFFTGDSLAKSLVGDDIGMIKAQDLVLDPACGAGDLLLKIAMRLPLKKTLKETLREWGESIAGFDLFEEFIVATKIRIALVAIQRGVKGKIGSIEELDKLLPNIKKHNALHDDDLYKKATMIVMNPPFQLVSCPDDIIWKKGKVTLSALFLEHCVSKTTSGTRIKTILPEVLRTGSTYKKWRDNIEHRVTSLKFESKGLFSPWGDVDVFTLELIKNETGIFISQDKWNDKENRRDMTMSNFYIINVGAVIPHRHKEEGMLYAYVHAKNVTPWCILSRVSEQRQFSGRVFNPPFIVVRRTSRPGAKYRAVASVITGKRKVAVENHLLVLTPKDNKYETCIKTMEMLKRKEVNDYLDKNMRCRHLTVLSLKELPWLC